MSDASGWRWISAKVALAAHDELLAAFGGLAGLRDGGALESALARPRNLAAYEDADAADLAAAYTYDIVRNHPFADGDKRTGYALALVFLLDNGYAFTAGDPESVAVIVSVAAGQTTETSLAAWFRALIRRIA